MEPGIDESPYAAPKAAVADAVPAGPPPALPRPMKAALVLAWAGLALLVVKTAWVLVLAPVRMAPSFLLMWAAGILALLVVNLGLGKARSWARILYFILAARNLFALQLIPIYFRRGGLQTFMGLFDVGIILVSLAACALLLTPQARAWFRAIGERA